MKKIKIVLCLLLIVMVLVLSVACDTREKVTIYTSTEEYNMEYMQKCLDAQFPNYKIVIEYMGTSNIAAKVKEEGADSDVDIIYAEEYGYMEMLIKAGVLDELKDYDTSKYVDEAMPEAVKGYVLPAIMTGGAVVINKRVMAAKGITEDNYPTKYEDLLDPKYSGLVSMASPKASGTGYMFYYSLVKAWGEEKALEYFDALSANVLAYTSSGSGPINALIANAGEVAVGFGMISQAVEKINGGNTDLAILFFEEGAPYNMYGNAIVKGKSERSAVTSVMRYLDQFYTNASNEKYYPEPVLKGTNYSIPNFPTNIHYADMTGNNLEKKTELLAKWTH